MKIWNSLTYFLKSSNFFIFVIEPIYSMGRSRHELTTKIIWSALKYHLFAIRDRLYSKIWEKVRNKNEFNEYVSTKHKMRIKTCF